MTTKSTKKLPTLAARARDMSPRKERVASPVAREVPIRSRAAPKLAPELMPRTKGPARGLRNRVCINNPLKESPPPTRMAVRAFGIRYSHMIYDQVSPDPPFKRMETTWSKGMSTEPELMFNNPESNRAIPRSTKEKRYGLVPPMLNQGV